MALIICFSLGVVFWSRDLGFNWRLRRRSENRCTFFRIALLTEILAEESGAADIGEIRIGLVVMRPAGPGEGVVHQGIAIERDLAIGLETCLDLGLGFGRDIFVGFRDMQHQGML